jgi:hypothetical protein
MRGGGLDALRALIGFETDLIDIVAAAGEGTHCIRRFARPQDVARFEQSRGRDLYAGRLPASIG